MLRFNPRIERGMLVRIERKGPFAAPETLARAAEPLRRVVFREGPHIRKTFDMKKVVIGFSERFLAVVRDARSLEIASRRRNRS